MSRGVEVLRGELESAGFRDVKLLSAHHDRTTVLARTADLRSVVVKVLPDSAAEVGIVEEVPPLPGLLVAAEVIPLRSGRVALVTPYQANGSLRELVERTGPLPVETASAYAAGIADALERLHGLGVVHGDLKPQNVLVGGDGAPLLIDFGSASVALPIGDATGGTPPFAAPELGAGTTPSPAADVYALGVTLHYLLTGSDPDNPALDRLVRGGSKEHDELLTLAEVLADDIPSRRPSAAAVRPLLAMHSALTENPPRRPDAYEALISFNGRTVRLSPENPLAVAGRAATDLPVGVDDYAVSRAAVEFRVSDGRLSINNLSHSNRVQVSTKDSKHADVLLELGAGYTAAKRDSVVTLMTTSKRYALSVVVGPGLLSGEERRPGGPVTVDSLARDGLDLPLTPVQLRLLAAYCLPLLRDSGANASSHTEVARMLGLSTMTTRNQMQKLTKRLAEAFAVPADKDIVCRAALRAGLIKPSTVALFPELDRHGGA
ncbi:protein kinase [Actinosynnema sp. NPDC023658]|uniref:serine/threonine-protein kinase n=1 Tax=Actinosynnema sp. NPDC023658 TaxID=3155465 RepID=UPI0033E8F323